MAETLNRPRVNVLALKPIEGGNLKAFADIAIGPLQINKVRLIQVPGQAAFTCGPQSEWVDGQGKKHYAPLVVQVKAATPFGREVKERAGLPSGRRAH